MFSKYKTHLFAFVLLSAISSPLYSQNNSLTIDECRKMAIESSYKLKNSKEQVLISNDMLKMYKTNFLPNLSLSGGYLYSTSNFSLGIEGGFLPTFVPDATTGALVPNLVPSSTDVYNSYAYMPDQNFDFEVSSVFSLGVQLSQPIYLGGKIATSVKLASVGVKAQELKQSLSESEVLLSLDNAFYTYIKVQDMLKSALSYQKVVAEFYTDMQNGLNAGMKTSNDLLTVQVKLNEAELMVRQAQNGVRLSCMNLCHYLGLPLTTRQLSLVDTFDSLPLANDQNLEVSQRAEYALLQKNIEAAELQVKLSRSDFLPQAAAVASYSYGYGGKINGATLSNGLSFTAGVTLSVPIFHWGEGRRQVSAAKRQATIAQNQLSDLSRQMTLELMQAINNYDESALQVKLMVSSVEQAEENLKQSRARYNAGMQTLSLYLEAQTLWNKAMSDLTEAKSNQRLAYSQYLKAAGMLVL